MEPSSKRCTKCRDVKPLTSEFFSPCRKRGEMIFEARCRLCKAEAQRDRNRRSRLDALRHYSAGVPACKCCGESLLEFLTIDHIGGGGTEHRRELRGRVSSIYLWLKRRGYPEGYRVLCMNCNFSLGMYGYCPHTPGRSDRPTASERAAAAPASRSGECVGRGLPGSSPG